MIKNAEACLQPACLIHPLVPVFGVLIRWLFKAVPTAPSPLTGHLYGIGEIIKSLHEHLIPCKAGSSHRFQRVLMQGSCKNPSNCKMVIIHLRAGGSFYKTSFRYSTTPGMPVHWPPCPGPPSSSPEISMTRSLCMLSFRSGRRQMWPHLCIIGGN